MASRTPTTNIPRPKRTRPAQIHTLRKRLKRSKEVGDPGEHVEAAPLRTFQSVQAKRRQKPTVTSDKNDKRRTIDQSTLTQIEFVNSPDRSFVHDASKTLARRRSTPASSSNSRRRRLAVKENSTLTQMDFFRNRQTTIQDSVELDTEFLLPEPSPRKPDPPSESTNEVGEDTTSRPRKRRRISEHIEIPDTTVDGSPPTKTRKQNAIPGQSSSMQMDHGAECLRTPVKQIRYADRIPSSQSPENLLPSTKKVRRSARIVKPQRGRVPLGELSTNSIFSRHGNTLEKLRSPSKSPERSQKRKICVLKIPPRAPVLRKSIVQDSQQDAWSVQISSSPKKVGTTKNTSEASTIKLSAVPSSPRSITPRKVQPRLLELQNTQQSLPDLSELLGIDSMEIPANIQPDVFGSDRATPRAMDIEDDNADMLFRNDPVDDLPEISSLTNSRDRSSENPAHPGAVTTKLATSEDTVILSQKQVTSRRTDKTSPEEWCPPDHAFLPIPKLVPSPARAISRPTSQTPRNTCLTPSGPQDICEHETLQLIPEQTTSARQTQTVSRDFAHSSSSPKLPPHPLPNSARRDRAIGMLPNPSQVSTQVPTQGLPSSHMVTQCSTQLGYGRDEQDVHRPVIIQSSSFHSKVPRVAEDEDEEDSVLLGDQGPSGAGFGESPEFDLDPATLARTQNLSRTQTGSSKLGTMQDATQPSQCKPVGDRSQLKRVLSTQGSVLITAATTKSQRDRALPVLELISSPLLEPQPDQLKFEDNHSSQANLLAVSQSQQTRTSRRTLPPTRMPHTDRTIDEARYPPSRLPNPDFTSSQPEQFRRDAGNRNVDSKPPPSSPLSSLSSPTSSATPKKQRTVKRRFEPLEGFDNDTQSDFTQGGHATAALVHKMRENGEFPDWFTPQPFVVPGAKRREIARGRGEATSEGNKLADGKTPEGSKGWSVQKKVVKKGRGMR